MIFCSSGMDQKLIYLLSFKEYMPLPPMLSFTRTKNLSDLLIRAKLPPPVHRQRRNKPPGFRRCGKRSNCSLCQHSGPGVTSSYTCPVTNETVKITAPSTCTDQGVYLALCKKDCGRCSQLAPIYVGECGDGEHSSFTHRFASHLGSSTQPCQVETVKPVG